MQVFTSLDQLQLSNNNAVTVGVYDGVHLGHQKVLKEVVSLARGIDGESVLLTFEKHPRIVLEQTQGLKLLNTLDEKRHELEKVGLDVLIIIPFTKEFASLTARDFVEQILHDKLKTKKLAIGFNHHFGKDREGSFAFLQEVGPEYGFEVAEISAEDVEEVKISSTQIRKSLESGDVRSASKLLGRNYSLSGTVVQGDKIGREIGFPTANIHPEDPYKQIPKSGAYAVNIYIEEQKYNGMLNIGHRPTVSNEFKESIEVNIFDFNREIYGNIVRVEFVSRIREEMTFKNLDLLAEQLQRDKDLCHSIL